MGTHSQIKAAIERVERVFSAKPEAARVTKSATVTWEDGLRCTAEDEGFKITADMAEAMGGEGAGPAPGALARMALGSCVAMSYAMSFARRGVAFTRLSVRVEADMDVRGALGMPDAPRGYTGVRCIIHVDSDADPALIESVGEEARLNSMVGKTFSNPTPVEFLVRLNASHIGLD